MMRLFHSYQYIPNSKEICFDKEKKQLKNSDGNFLLGLLQIPDFQKYELIVEKYYYCRVEDIIIDSSRVLDALL